MAKETLRKCIGCFELKKREELIKITREYESNEVFINPDSKIFGRSVYLCYNKTCIENSFKKNKLAKFLKSAISEELKATLQNFHTDVKL